MEAIVDRSTLHLILPWEISIKTLLVSADRSLDSQRSDG
jgi:hypothetical protein